MSTLPFSPLPYILPPLDNSAESTITLLDSLVEFYQHERVWIDRTRAVLEDAFQASASTRFDAETTLPSPPPDIVGIVSKCGPTGEIPCKQPSQLLRRQGFKSDRPLVAVESKSVRPIKSRKDFSQRKEILDALDRMMEARIDSCRRVNRIVRDANRADLYCR